MKKNCPRCGNVVEGQVKASFTRKMTRAAIKKGSAMATGAAIGSIIPGLGTIVGSAIGLAAGVLMEDDVKKVSDVVEDIAFDNSNAEYDFCCPKCGYQWKSGASMNVLESTSESFSTNYPKEDIDEESDEQAAFSEYFHWCAENTEDAIRGFEEVERFCNASVADCSNDVVRSEFLFLLSWLRMERLIKNRFFAPDDEDADDIEFDLEEIKTGYDEIKRAIKLFGENDDEYVALKKIYALWISPHGDNFDAGWAYIRTNPLSDYAPQNNLINVDYMKILWQKCAAGFIYGLVIIDDNDDSISFARTKRVFEHYNYIKRNPNEAPDIYGLWLSLADCLALKYYNGIGCDVDYKKAHELIKITSQAGRVLGSFLKAHQYFYGNGVNRNIGLAKNTLKEVIDGTNDSPELFWRGKAIELLETIEDGESYAVEDEYLDMVKEMLEDGQISDRERRLLEKLRVKLGISEERAAELEASLSASQLAEEEQDYLNEYREMLSDDGEISPRERKLLDKIARMNGISPERVRELESMA